MIAAVMQMARTTVDVDDARSPRHERTLGTQGLSATINSALREVARRQALADFDVLRDFDGTPDEVRSGRTARGGATTA
jgi:Arc/MetJ family transcription regulator